MYQDFSEFEIQEIFTQWLNGNGFEIAERTIKRNGTRIEARLFNQARRENQHKTAAAFTLYTDRPVNGFYTDWKSGAYVKWNLYNDYIVQNRDASYCNWYKSTGPSPEELERRQKAREAEAEAEYQSKLREAQEFYNRAIPSPATHDYTDAKRVPIHSGVKLDGTGNLLIPLWDLADYHGEDSTIYGYQRISADGDKYFNSGSRISGKCYIIGNPTGGEIAVCEGYATAATVHEITGYPVIVSFNSGNLPKVAEAVKVKYPTATIRIFADNDLWTSRQPDQHGKNPGLDSARKAAQNINLPDKFIIAPPDAFSARGKAFSDWNDFYRENGADKTRNAIRDAQKPLNQFLATLQEPTFETLRKLEEQRGEGVDLGISAYYNDQRGDSMKLMFKGLTIIGARTGGGKTLTLSGIAAKYLESHKNGTVVFVSLEQPFDEIYSLILANVIRQRTVRTIDITNQQLHKVIKYGADKAATFDTLNHDGNGGISVFGTERTRAIQAAQDSIVSRVKIIDLSTQLPSGMSAERADFIAELIETAQEQYNGEVVFIIDYIQRLSSGQDKDSYRELKQVMSKLLPSINNGACVFAAAQLNRDVAKAANGNPAAEFWGAYSEQLREAGDLEQGARMILYCTIDRDSIEPALNIRLLKNRGGAVNAALSVPVDFQRGGLQWDRQDRPTLTITETTSAAKTTAKAQKQADGGKAKIGIRHYGRVNK